MSLSIFPQHFEAQIKDGETSTNIAFKDSVNAEKIASSIAIIILIVGILFSIFCLFTICWVDSGRYHYTEDLVFNPAGFIATISILITSILQWAIIAILCNISESLKVIRFSKVGA